MDCTSGEWRSKTKKTQSQSLYLKVSICSRSQNEIIKAVMVHYPCRKRPLGRIRWANLIKKNVESLGGGSNWK